MYDVSCKNDVLLCRVSEGKTYLELYDLGMGSIGGTGGSDEHKK